jgi:hypothetical protein
VQRHVRPLSAGKVLIKCQDYFLTHPDAQPAPGYKYKVTNGTLETYEDIAELAFGQKGREIISLILYTELIGTCALFLILQKGMLLLQGHMNDSGCHDATANVTSLRTCVRGVCEHQ